MILIINKTYKAILLVDVLLGLCLVITLYYIGDLSFKNYYSAKLDQRKVQVDMFDKALEGYANNHLAIKNITYDEEGKQNVIYQKTYPSSLDELEKNGYIKLLSDEDMDNFKYTPKKETTYGNTQNIVSYELKVKIPNSDSYYISPGSIRSEYMSKE